jgi:hypothetical protein
VKFRWRDYADSNRVKESTVEAEEFLRRFLMHVLPDRFVRIRYFGFFANRRRAENVRRARVLIGHHQLLQFPERPRPQRLCPACRAAAVAPSNHPEQAISALRSPPQTSAA